MHQVSARMFGSPEGPGTSLFKELGLNDHDYYGCWGLSPESFGIWTLWVQHVEHASHVRPAVSQVVGGGKKGRLHGLSKAKICFLSQWVQVPI